MFYAFPSRSTVPGRPNVDGLIMGLPFLACPPQTGRKQRSIPCSSWGVGRNRLKSSYFAEEGHGSPPADRTHGSDETADHPTASTIVPLLAKHHGPCD